MTTQCPICPVRELKRGPTAPIAMSLKVQLCQPAGISNFQPLKKCGIPFLVCSERLKKEDGSANKVDVWSMLKNASTREYDAIAFKFGIIDMRSMLRRLSQMSKSGNKKSPCTFINYLCCFISYQSSSSASYLTRYCR